MNPLEYFEEQIAYHKQIIIEIEQRKERYLKALAARPAGIPNDWLPVLGGDEITVVQWVSPELY